MKKMERIKDDLFKPLTTAQMRTVGGDLTLSQHITGLIDIDSMIDP